MPSEEIANQYIWCNENIIKPDGHTINYAGISKLGLHYVKDTIVDGRILTVHEINQMDVSWERKLELLSTIKCIPKSWKQTVFPKKINLQTISSKRLENINTKNTTKALINMIKVQPTSEQFFMKLLNVTNAEMEEFYGVPFRTTIYTKLRSFQFKVNHNIIYTNQKLYKIGYSSTELCTFCNAHIETLHHLFVDCQKVKQLWSQVTHAILSPYGIEKLSKKYILLGILLGEKQNNVVNHILIEAKYYIYICKQEKSIPIYRRLKNRLKIMESIEREIARTTLNKTKQHTYKWHHLMEHLLDT